MLYENIFRPDRSIKYELNINMNCCNKIGFVLKQQKNSFVIKSYSIVGSYYY